MKIEDHWEDAFLYYVQFKVKQDKKLRTIRKSIVIYSSLTDLEVHNLIFSRFNNVESVESVEWYDEVLLIKK